MVDVRDERGKTLGKNGHWQDMIPQNSIAKWRVFGVEELQFRVPQIECSRFQMSQFGIA